MGRIINAVYRFVKKINNYFENVRTVRKKTCAQVVPPQGRPKLNGCVRNSERKKNVRVLGCVVDWLLPFLYNTREQMEVCYVEF